MKFGIISIFPQLFDSIFSFGVTARAVEKKLIECHFINPRAYTEDNYKRVDDRPFGGGPGMVMLYEPLAKAISHAKELVGYDVPVVYVSPQGKTLSQSMANEFSLTSGMIILCGRYEGVDQRIIDEFVDYEVSIGDYVLSGGELAAAVIIDTVARMIPGVLNHKLSSQEDSFFDGLLDCPHYTRPRVLPSGEKVPDVLISGNHADIKRWRDMMKLGITRKKRPELIKRRCLSEYEKTLLNEYESSLKKK
ncbi:tRNA (guanosine(37)-N1)-methyltransferase TrmD [Thiotrichales bacterium 19S3-7]|nr:tRNA (guanosine(37)-N1)-methyltransferase TrmD [Thiotrichales bacterium 19S3-7]MCF6801775.1 tRNA (guanosine(37)-N1)-methyltransferase TrmD [Thiotrichales bacterium 19S3-11]